MLDALSGTEEYQDRFVGMNNEEIIESIYQALFGREADPEGLAVFLEALENGTQTLSSIAVNILDGAQGEDLAMIENKIAAADIFTASLDTDAEIAAYDGNEAAAYGREFLSTVTEDPETVPTEEEVQADIDADLPGYTPEEGQAPGGGGGGGGVTPPTFQQRAEAIHAEWQDLDTYYNDYYIDDVNEAFIRLGVQYVDYLNDGGPVLTSIRVKDSDPDVRDQSLHDNLLGNLTLGAIEDRNLPDELEAELIDLVESVGAKFLDRPYEDGAPPKAFSAADEWDALNGVDRPDLVQTLVELDNAAESDFGGIEWVQDRAALEMIEWAASPTEDGNDVIAFNVNEEGVTSGFARYQGAKIVAEEGELNAAHGSTVSVDFYIDPEWALDDDAQLSGVWVQMATPDTNAQSWSMIEYLDKHAGAERSLNEHPDNGDKPEPGFVGFRFWNSEEGFNEYVQFEADGWVNMTFEFTEEAHIWYVNGEEIYRDEGLTTASASVIETLIFNNQNFGNDESYLYDNVKVTGVSVNENFYSTHADT
ncbi:DUF4214 domain-containing protein [Mesorhizobium sp. CAU 1741]|uniref:DUF4214 domain-containing protein n=1 Tax=Mesorhizobium sp. CAU 1741 TaxID=3140366 RepID=UPI00325AB624